MIQMVKISFYIVKLYFNKSNLFPDRKTFGIRYKSTVLQFTICIMSFSDFRHKYFSGDRTLRRQGISHN
jgi:hypothetical protein